MVQSKYEKKLQLLGALAQNGKLPDNFRAYIPTKSIHIYINKGIVETRNYSKGVTAYVKSERGSILDVFAMIEFLINELIRMKLLGFETLKSDFLLDLISRGSLDSKIQTLKKHKVISPEVAKKFGELKKVRDGLAHKFSPYEIQYYGTLLLTMTKDTSNFKRFKKDLEFVWSGITTSFEKEMINFDLDKLIENIKAYQSKF